MRSIVVHGLVVALLAFSLGCEVAAGPAAQPSLVPTPEPTRFPTDVPTLFPTDAPPADRSPASATPPTEPQPTPTLAGAAGLYLGEAACGVCHALEGIAHGVMGPDLTGIGTAAETRIPGMSAEEYIRESIVDPDAYVVGTADGLDEDYLGGLMSQTTQGLGLSDEQVDALVQFLLEQK